MNPPNNGINAIMVRDKNMKIKSLFMRGLRIGGVRYFTRRDNILPIPPVEENIRFDTDDE